MMMRPLRARSLLNYTSRPARGTYRSSRLVIHNGYCSSCANREVEASKLSPVEEPVQAGGARLKQVEEANLKKAEKGSAYAITPTEKAAGSTLTDAPPKSRAPMVKLNTTTANLPTPPADHREIGFEQALFMTSKYSPGSPLFLPYGARIFNKLVSFLRAQYRQFGFQEVITPTIYKKSLWDKSGHLENYADDMFSVTGRGAKEERHGKELEEDEAYGLKPMNCPGHCLMFASQTRSFRDLPIRYADFSPLHRNEISGALSGLTRVRRFHQDDGHIFCRPSQVGAEIKKTLEFVKLVYETFKLGPYRLVLSTRPKEHFIGSLKDWATAESALREALDDSGQHWSLNEGDGAFYGPKIDIILKDSDQKEHQTATIQLDFQLPKRFELHYEAPAPELEKRGLTSDDPEVLATSGPVQPVMIHRAVLGSLERFFALLTEHYAGRWPFWLNPRQIALITVNDTPKMLEYAHWALEELSRDPSEKTRVKTLKMPNSMYHVNFDIEVDSRPVSVGKKISEAKRNHIGVVVVVGKKNMETNTVDADLSRISSQELKWELKSHLKQNNNPLSEEITTGKDTGPLGEKFRSVNLQPAYLRQLLVILDKALC